MLAVCYNIDLLTKQQVKRRKSIKRRARRYCKVTTCRNILWVARSGHISAPAPWESLTSWSKGSLLPVVGEPDDVVHGQSEGNTLSRGVQPYLLVQSV